jgi:pantothenate kinase
MAKQLICGLTTGGFAIKPYIEIGKKLKYKVVKKNTHICLCQGNNYYSCSVGHIVPLN